MIGSLSHLIRGAAIEAIQSGTEQITRKLGHHRHRPRRPAGSSSRDGCRPTIRDPPVMADAGWPLRPLPIRPGPVSGESTYSYIRRLAVANHLRPMHLRRYLKDPVTVASDLSGVS